MVVSFYEKTNELDLAGTCKGLDFFSEELLIDGAIVNLEYEKLESFPETRYLQLIRVKHFPNNAVKISVEDNYLLIEGSLEKIKILSANLETQGSKLKNYHIHIEYYDEHLYLSKDSMPLVVMFQ